MNPRGLYSELVQRLHSAAAPRRQDLDSYEWRNLAGKAANALEALEHRAEQDFAALNITASELRGCHEKIEAQAAEIARLELALSDREDKYIERVMERDRLRAEMSALIDKYRVSDEKSEHVCGLQGFGAPGDVCPACSPEARGLAPSRKSAR